ncbi:MAG: molybdate ABC transporter permease subunit [Eubacteriales bacterium]|nr:molybdate ABC transporter permease subunit [Eubacteriales bacterium]
MDWYPLFNSLRIALISSVIVFFTGIFAAYYIARLNRAAKGILDVVLTLPLVLPPTVVGYFLLVLLGTRRPLGMWVMEHWGVKLVMTWYSGIFAAAVVAFPLMYRTARGAFESFDETLADAGKTLGLSNTWIFWHIRMPACRQGILAGAVLAFARALGEYGATSMLAGYTPGKTATISTTVYQLWRTDNEALAFRWVMVNLAISAVVLLTVNMLERREKRLRSRQLSGGRGD